MSMHALLDNAKEMWISMPPYYIKSLYDGLPKCIRATNMLMDASQV